MFKTIPRTYFLPALIWFILIFILLMLPGDDLSPAEALFFPQFDKIVHAGLFGAMVFWLTLPIVKKMSPSHKYYLIVAIGSSLYGIAMEFMQKWFAQGRAFDIDDMCADIAGALLACYLMKYIAQKIQTRQRAAG